jgi:hypothetical protein
METGTLLVGRIKGKKDKFIMVLVNAQKGRILESSKELTEDELRTVLTENYGESESQIEERIGLAKAHPENLAQNR